MKSDHIFYILQEGCGKFFIRFGMNGKTPANLELTKENLESCRKQVLAADPSAVIKFPANLEELLNQ